MRGWMNECSVRWCAMVCDGVQWWSIMLWHVTMCVVTCDRIVLWRRGAGNVVPRLWHVTVLFCEGGVRGTTFPGSSPISIWTDNKPCFSSSNIPQELIMVELNIVVNFSQLMCCKNEKKGMNELHVCWNERMDERMLHVTEWGGVRGETQCLVNYVPRMQ